MFRKVAWNNALSGLVNRTSRPVVIYEMSGIPPMCVGHLGVFTLISSIRRFRCLNLVVYRKVEPEALPFRPFIALIIRVTASG